jgi:hypothetical protein
MCRAAAAASLVLPLAAGATVRIDVEISSLGGNLWHYDYILSGETFNAPPAAPGPHGFSIYFDYAVYGALSNESTTNATWDMFSEQPDAGFLRDGLFDALAGDSPSSTGAPFGIDFEWVGTSTPTGIQRFEVYTCADVDCFSLTVVQEGNTRPAATPLPGSLALIAVGLIGLGLRRARRTDDS